MVHTNQPGTLNTASLRHHITSLVPTWHDENLIHFEFLSGGYSNQNYRFTHADKIYVLRLPLGVQPFVDRTHEAAWYQRLPADIGVKPIAFDEHSGRMITTWVEGPLLVDAWPNLSQQDLTNYLTRLHTTLPQDLRRYDVGHLSRAYLGHSVSHPKTPPATRLITCHNDLNPWNIIVTPSGWITLDWEFVGLNDPLFDLVSLHQGLALPEDELQELAASFCGASDHDLTHRLLAAQHQFWLREMAWATYQINQGNRRAEIVEQQRMAKVRLARLKSS